MNSHTHSWLNELNKPGNLNLSSHPLPNLLESTRKITAASEDLNQIFLFGELFWEHPGLCLRASEKSDHSTFLKVWSVDLLVWNHQRGSQSPDDWICSPGRGPSVVIPEAPAHLQFTTPQAPSPLLVQCGLIMCLDQPVVWKCFLERHREFTF